MNYAIVSAVHGRPAIAEAWAAWLAKHFPGKVVVAGDDIDIHNRMILHLKDQLVWVPYCNEPLGAKFNRAAEHAVRYSQWVQDLEEENISHLLVLGSDDFPSPMLLRGWYTAAMVGAQFACLSSLYFHGLTKRETSVLTPEGVTKRGAFGTGRLYPTAKFGFLFNTYGYAWEPALPSALDRSLWMAMGEPKPDFVIDQTDDVWCMAVKSDEDQKWTYDHLKARLNMPVVGETLPESAQEFLKWIHEQPGVLTPKLKMTVKQN